MTLKEKLRDIRALINEIYEDETDPARLASRDCFRRYCSEIEDGLAKLRKLEDIEDKSGIDLLTLYKASTNGIYRKMADGVTFFPPDQISVYLNHIMTESGKMLYGFEYGDTWALTKEELL